MSKFSLSFFLPPPCLESILRSVASSDLNDGLQLFIEWYLWESAPLWTWWKIIDVDFSPYRCQSHVASSTKVLHCLKNPILSRSSISISLHRQTINLICRITDLLYIKTKNTALANIIYEHRLLRCFVSNYLTLSWMMTNLTGRSFLFLPWTLTLLLWVLLLNWARRIWVNFNCVTVVTCSSFCDGTQAGSIWLQTSTKH